VAKNRLVHDRFGNPFEIKRLPLVTPVRGRFRRPKRALSDPRTDYAIASSNHKKPRELFVEFVHRNVLQDHNDQQGAPAAEHF
jgi:hypothetical protein